MSFGREDIGKELAAIQQEQLLQRNLLVNLTEMVGVLMALASIEQSVLDEIGTQLQTVADGVQAIIDDPSNDLGPADLSGITDAVSRLQGLVSEPETPVDGGDTPAEPTA